MARLKAADDWSDSLLINKDSRERDHGYVNRGEFKEKRIMDGGRQQDAKRKLARDCMHSRCCCKPGRYLEASKEYVTCEQKR